MRLSYRCHLTRWHWALYFFLCRQKRTQSKLIFFGASTLVRATFVPTPASPSSHLCSSNDRSAKRRVDETAWRHFASLVFLHSSHVQTIIQILRQELFQNQLLLLYIPVPCLLVEKHLSDSHFAGTHFAGTHFAVRHFAGRHFAALPL